MKQAEFQKVKLHILENQPAHKLQTVYNQHYSVSDLFAVGGDSRTPPLLLPSRSSRQ